jgi:hypothetical protein
MTAVEVLQYAVSHGLTLGVRGGDHIVVRGSSAVIEALKPELAARKPELVTELRRKSRSHDGARCDCRSFGEHYDRGGSWDGWNAKLALEREARAAEWRVDCPVFVALADGSELGACLACGGSWELHGEPPRASWRIVTLDESVALHVARFFVVQRAEAIARDER